MDKKIAIIASVIALAVVSVLIVIFINLGAIKDEATISKIKEDSFLDILVNLGNYSPTNYDDENLLDVSMRIAEKLGLLNESTEDGNYVQYVNENDLHNIIYELTGHTVEAPIEIDDFYYLYDSEHEYYFYVPAAPNYFSVKNISSMKANNSNYSIVCSIEKSEDLEVTDLNDVKVSLTYMPENSFVKYRVEKVEFSK